MKRASPRVTKGETDFASTGPVRPTHPLSVHRGRQESHRQIRRRGIAGYVMTPQEFGRATEARFMHEALRHGLLVSKPFDSVPSYDMVVDNGHRLFKVQVKGITAYRPTPGRRPRYYVPLWRGSRSVTPRFDVCAIYLRNDDRWVFRDHTVATLRSLAITENGKHDGTGWEIFQPR